MEKISYEIFTMIFYRVYESVVDKSRQWDISQKPMENRIYAAKHWLLFQLYCCLSACKCKEIFLIQIKHEIECEIEPFIFKEMKKLLDYF